MNNILAALLLQTLKSVLTTSVTVLLQTHKRLHGEERNKQLREAIRNSFLLLKDVTDKTQTKVDDTVVDIVLQGVNDSEI